MSGRLTSRQEDATFSHEQIKELIQLISERGIEQFEVDSGDFHLKIIGRRPPRPIISSAHSAPVAMVPAEHAPRFEHQDAPARNAVAAPPASAPPVTPLPEEDLKSRKITAPMVGTLYRAPAPDAPPFVSVGDRVEEDTVLCIIEAMKLMNEIKAEMRGVVRRVLAENGQPVEYGQPIFAIEPF